MYVYDFIARSKKQRKRVGKGKDESKHLGDQMR